MPLRMPGRSGPANGRKSTADENVPVPRPEQADIERHRQPNKNV